MGSDRTEEKKMLIKQLQLISERLRIEGAKIPTETLIVEYDNGGGQSGVRENPFYPAYEKLLSSFVKTLEAVEKIDDGNTAEIKSLADFRNKLKVAK